MLKPAGKESEIQKLKDRLRQIQTGATPQTDGLEFEGNLCLRLAREFPDDSVLQKGKGGDILHLVRSEGKEVGTPTDLVNGSMIRGEGFDEFTSTSVVRRKE
jgi:hypothetical protein